MAARNPSSYIQWLDESKMRPGEPVLASSLDSVFDDQEFTLDQPTMVLTWSGIPYCEGGAAWNDQVVFYGSARDMCDVADVTNDEIACDFWAYCFWTGNSAAAGDVRLTSGQAVANQTSTINLASIITTGWYQGDTINIKTNGNEDDLTLAMRMTGGAGSICVQSILIIARGT